MVAITDGDTITVRCGEPGSYERISVRISAIDAPEKSQAFGRASRQRLAELCFHQRATINPKTKDRYGRMVADVECRGQDVAAVQVQAGMAWFYVKYGKGYEHLSQLESQARQNERGLWALPSAEPPWKWRRDSAHASPKS